MLVLALLTVGALALALTQAFATSNAPPAASADYVDADLIRVGISNDDMTALEYPYTRLSATGPFTVKDQGTGVLLFSGKAGDEVGISKSQAGFYLKTPLSSGMNAASAPVPPMAAPVQTLSPPSPVTGPLLLAVLNPADRIRVNNITRRKEVPEFRGWVEVMPASSSPVKLTVVNVLSLEDYLKAVVPNELPMRYGLEAVKAQAVAARNYAIRPREKPWKTFDICDSQLCQVYLGAQTETPDSNRAIADTEGLVGLYNGDPILALFSSSHGGYAEAYSNAFSDPLTKQYPAPPIAYLVGGPDLPLSAGLDLRTEAGARKFWMDGHFQSFDVDSPYYRWRKQWTRAELEGDINRGLLEVSKDGSTRDFVHPLFQSGQSIGVLKGVTVLERGLSGKAMRVALAGSRGRWVVEKEFLIRKVFKKQGKMLPSGNVVFTPQKNAKGQLIGYAANGGGFGHGVGLSQLGASWMHQHGYAFPQIIQHYYKGVSLGSLPISVGGNHPNKPVLTRFDVARPQGTLWIQEGDNAASWPKGQAVVTVQLNGKTLTLAPTGFRSGVAVNGYLQPNALNTLVLMPDARHADRKLKAWVELYPPAPETPAARS